MASKDRCGRLLGVGRQVINLARPLAKKAGKVDARDIVWPLGRNGLGGELVALVAVLGGSSTLPVSF